jgi:hypothetical protein
LQQSPFCLTAGSLDAGAKREYSVNKSAKGLKTTITPLDNLPWV